MTRPPRRVALPEGSTRHDTRVIELRQAAFAEAREILHAPFIESGRPIPEWYRWHKVWGKAARLMPAEDVPKRLRAILDSLAQRADNTTGYCGRVSRAELERESDQSPRTISRAIADGERAALLRRRSSAREGLAWEVWLLDDRNTTLEPQSHPPTPSHGGAPPGQRVPTARHGGNTPSHDGDHVFSDSGSPSCCPPDPPRAGGARTSKTTKKRQRKPTYQQLAPAPPSLAALSDFDARHREQLVVPPLSMAEAKRIALASGTRTDERWDSLVECIRWCGDDIDLADRRLDALLETEDAKRLAEETAAGEDTDDDVDVDRLVS